MRGQTPIEEINIEEYVSIVEKTKELQLDKFEKRKESFIKQLNRISLDDIANNKPYNYKPIQFDFAYILKRMKSNLANDNDTESLQVKLDIAEQLSKLNKVPSLNTECHIESRYVDKNTSFKSFILKNIFGQKKYRLVFHKVKFAFDEMYYNKQGIPKLNEKIVIIEAVLLALSIVLGSVELLAIMYLLIMATLALEMLIKCMI